MKLFNTSKLFIITGLVLGLVAAWTCTTATEMNTNSIMNIFGGDNPPGVGWEVRCYQCTSHSTSSCVGSGGSGTTCGITNWTISYEGTPDNTLYGNDDYCHEQSSSCADGYTSLWCHFQ